MDSIQNPENNTRSRFDSRIIGTIAGILLPTLSLLIFFSSYPTKQSIGYMVEYSRFMKIIPQIISLCVIPNLGLFFLFMWRNHLRSARGVILATIILAFVVLLIKGFL